MEKPDSTPCSGASTVFNTVFIDTSLDTHLAMIVSDTETVSDLKKKIMYEHPLCFPNIGEIKINALKVKRKGYLYHLSDSMFVKSAFVGVSNSWFLSVDTSISKEHIENSISCKPDAGKGLACLGVTAHNTSADVVDILPGVPSKRLSTINDVSLPQDEGKYLAKQISASQQPGFSNSAREKPEGLHTEVEHTADSDSKLFPTNNKELRRASVSVSVLKEKQKTRKRKKGAINAHDAKENGALAVESGKDGLDSGRSLLSDKSKRAATRKRMADEGKEVPGELPECETNKSKDVSPSGDHKSVENFSQYGPVLNKKSKAEKEDGNEYSLTENGVLRSDFCKQGTIQNTMTSKSRLDEKLERIGAIVDQLRTKFAKDNNLLTANASSGRKKRKKQKSNPSQVGNEISSAKDVQVDSGQAIETIDHKDCGNEADPEFILGRKSAGGAISEPCLIPSTDIQEVSKTNGVPHSGGHDGTADTKDDDMECQIEAHEPNVVPVIKKGDSIDKNFSHLESHPALVSQEDINLQNDIEVSGHKIPDNTLEDKTVEPKKSSKKIKKSKKTKDSVGGIEAIDSVHRKGPASDLFPVDCPNSLNGNHLTDNAELDGTKDESKIKKSDCLPSVTDVRDNLCDNAEQDGTSDGKEESNIRKTECSHLASDVRADDVIRDVLESLHQCNNTPANSETMGKKSGRKTKKRNSTALDPPELLGKDDINPQDSAIPADNVSEMSASSKSTKKIVKANSIPAAQLNKSSDLGSNDNTGVGISPVCLQLDSSKNTLDTDRDRRPTQDVVSVYHPKSSHVDGVNTSIEVPSRSEKVESLQHQENVDSGKILGDKMTDRKEVETAVKGKRNDEALLGGFRPELPSPEMFNRNQRKKTKTQAVKSSSMQSQRSSKAEPCSSKSESVVKEPLLSNKSEKVNTTSKDAPRPVDNNSVKAHTNLDKYNHSVSSSSVERSKKSINLIKGVDEHLDIAKATGSNKVKELNRMENKKSLLAKAGTIFKHNDKESSDDEDGVDSDASTKTPSDS